MSALLSVGACVALFFASFIGIHHTITIAQPNLDNKVTITIARPAPAVAEPVAQPTPVIPPPPVPVEQNPVERVVPKESVNPIQEVIP